MSSNTQKEGGREEEKGRKGGREEEGEEGREGRVASSMFHGVY